MVSNYFHFTLYIILTIIFVSCNANQNSIQENGFLLSFYEKTIDEKQVRDPAKLGLIGGYEYEILAEKLMYTHPNNFVRAFKRWSGITPREFIRLRNR